VNAEADIFGDGQMREQCIVLKHHANLPLLGGNSQGWGAKGLAIEQDFAAADGFKPGDGAQSRGFATAGRPQQTAYVTFSQANTQVVDDQLPAIAAFEVVQL